MRIDKDPDIMGMKELADILEFIGDDVAAKSPNSTYRRKQVFTAIVRGDVYADKTITEKAKKMVSKEIELDPKIWTTDHERVGKMAYHPNGAGLVKAVSLDGRHFILTNKLGDRRVTQNSTRFEAIPKEIHNRYTRRKNASGRYSLSNNDRLSALLLPFQREELERICEENGIDAFKYAHLNDGMFRMCMGNKFRAMSREKKPIIIKGVEHYDVYLPNEEHPDA